MAAKNLTIHDISRIRKEIEIKKKILVKLAHQGRVQDAVHKEMIRKYIEKSEIPEKPFSVQDVMIQFITSACSYSVLRKYLTRSNGGQIPAADHPRLLSQLFDESRFLKHDSYLPDNLMPLAKNIQARNNYNLDKLQPEPRIISVLFTAPKQFKKELKDGLDSFYKKIEEICRKGGERMWNFVDQVQRPIRNVGIALLCDFFKEIGFVRFVKPDFHMLNEFPKMTDQLNCKKSSGKQLFLSSQKLADQLEITPFHLDKLLYLWGWANSNGLISGFSI